MASDICYTRYTPPLRIHATYYRKAGSLAIRGLLVTTLNFIVPISVGVICAAPIYNGWYRAQVVVSHVDCDEYDIKFVDYGGYVRMQGCQLRQIRYENPFVHKFILGRFTDCYTGALYEYVCWNGKVGRPYLRGQGHP